MNNIYAIVANGVVSNVIEWDGESEWQPESGEVVLVDGACGIGWSFDGKSFKAPELPAKTLDELIVDAEREKIARLEYANTVTADWRTELVLGIISDEDKAKLITWMQYIKDVKAVDTSLVPNINWSMPPAE
ncbi:TPA: tail fiber assembly protein [Escherichia coli]